MYIRRIPIEQLPTLAQATTRRSINLDECVIGVCGQVEGMFRMFEARNGNVPFRNGAVLALPAVDLSISES